jgi:Mg2+/Co2+ transporter CorB
MNVRDLNRELGINLPDHASTISGLMMHNLERLPDVGDKIIFGCVTLTVLTKRSYRIQSVMVDIIEDRSE